MKLFKQDQGSSVIWLLTCSVVMCKLRLQSFPHLPGSKPHASDFMTPTKQGCGDGVVESEAISGVVEGYDRTETPM